MVIIVAFLLAFVSSALKPMQDANVALDKKKQILASLNIRDCQKSEIENTYNEVVVADRIIDQNGKTVQEGADKDKAGFLVENKNITPEQMPVYVCQTKDGVKYVIPMTGRGLWGGLWGYIALDADLQTIYGAYFSHESETAGLGALIVEKKFQELFNGKKVYADGNNDQVVLTVVKHGSVKNEAYEVDGITGATLTSNGVAAMVNEGLQKYMDALKAAVQTPAETSDEEVAPAEAAAADEAENVEEGGTDNE